MPNRGFTNSMPPTTTNRDPGDSLSCTVIEMITALSKRIQCRRALGPRDGRLGGPCLGPIVPGGVVRGAGRPPAVRPAETRGPPVDRVRPAPRDEPAPRPRRLRDRDRGARPREPEPDPLGSPRHGPRGRRPPRLDHLAPRG